MMKGVLVEESVIFGIAHNACDISEGKFWRGTWS
jgi:hypothetical protein